MLRDFAHDFVAAGVGLAACCLSIAGLVGGLGVSAAMGTPVGESGLPLEALASAQNPEQIEYIRQMYSFFQIVDAKFLRHSIGSASDYRSFKDSVDAWIASSPERWDALQSRLLLCRELEEAGLLKTEFTAACPDVRWALLVQHGRPIGESVFPIRNDTGAACSLWTYTWPPEGEGRGLEVSCKSLPGTDYPVLVVTEDDAGFPTARPIWPLVGVSQFSDSAGAVDLWFSVWIKGNEFSRITLEEAILTTIVRLHDSTRTNPIAEQRATTNIQAMRGILEATDRRDRRFIRAMSYVELKGITPGNYAAQVIVAGAHANDGEKWIDIVVEGSRRVSDLLLLHQSASREDNTLPGIERNTRSGLYNNPEATFAPGAELHLYAEATLPGGTDGTYEIFVTLLPIPAIARVKKGIVEVGNALVAADSLNQPIVDGKWQSALSPSELDSLARCASPTAAQVLFRRRFKTSTDSIRAEVSLRLDKKLKTGDYLLALTISDPQHHRFFLPARRMIKVVAPGSYLSLL